MGKNHIRLLANSRTCDLVGVVEPVSSLKSPLEKGYRIQVFSDVEQALRELAFDAAVVATPTETHFDITRSLLMANKHVLVEKPITAEATQSHELAKLAKDRDLVFFGGHVERFNPAVSMLKTKIHEIGSIYHIEAERTGPFPERIFSVGVGTDLLVHDVDLALMLTEMIPKWVFAHKERRVHPNCEDGITAIMGFDSEIIAVLKANWLSPTKERRFRIYGSRGMFEVDNLSRNLRFFENNVTPPIEDNFGLFGMEEGNQIKFKIMPSEPLANELDYFVRAIVSGKWDKSIIECNIRAVEIVNKILESAQKSEKIPLS